MYAESTNRDMGAVQQGFLCAVVTLFFVAFFSPQQVEAQSLPIEFYCAPYTETYVEGGYYNTTSGVCTYISTSFPFGNRVGVVYRGTVGSSTLLNGHFLGIQSNIVQFGQQIVDPVQGEDFFTVIRMLTPTPGESQQFNDYFTQGVGEPPHGDWGIIRWKWGIPPLTLPDPVIIIPGLLGSAKKNGVWVIDPILHVYDNLIDTFKANGFIEGITLFTFPYDWRQSNVLTAQELKNKINEVQSICGCEKVDLIAHSMGGLVARQYVQSDSYDNDVDQLFFLGTPHLGAPKAYLMWEGGEVLLEDAGDIVLSLKLSLEARVLGFDSLFDYIQSWPVFSIRDLLPIYSYLTYESGNPPIYPLGHPTNDFLERLDSGSDLIVARNIRPINFVGSFSDGALGSLVVRESESLPKWLHGMPITYIRGEGDKTVPTLSARAYFDNVDISDAKHIWIPSAAAGDIFRSLTNFDPSEIIMQPLPSGAGILFIQLLSPIDMYVLAPDGKRIGLNFEGGEFSEIEGAFYSGNSTDDEYITIPNPIDGEYKIITKGTDDGGQYTIFTSLITDNGSSSNEFIGTTTPELITEVKAVIQGNEVIELIPIDEVAPTITVTSPENTDYTRSLIQIDATSTDVGVGVDSMTMTLDGEVVINQSELDLFFENLGEHSFSIVAKDRVGNIASSTVIFRNIATIDRTLSDIERAYILGWITSEKAKRSLIVKLKAAIVLRKIVQNSSKPKVEKFAEKIDRILIRLFLKELENQRGRGVTEEGYKLLKEDIDWLVVNES